jgi:hypothetical protein
MSFSISNVPFSIQSLMWGATAVYSFRKEERETNNCIEFIGTYTIVQQAAS